jgi:MFS family permease
MPDFRKAATFAVGGQQCRLLMRVGLKMHRQIKSITSATVMAEEIAPRFVNGLLGSFYALLGFSAASIARRMASQLSPVRVFCVLAVLVFVGLLGLCLATPLWGVWVVIPLGLAMPMMSYFVSSYLNQWTDSAVRATILSFRGMALNIGYALSGIGFASLTASIRASGTLTSEDAIFGKALLSLPIAFALGWVALTLVAWRSRGKISATSGTSCE